MTGNSDICRGSVSTNPAMLGLFKDYADYTGAESVIDLSEMLIEEHHGVVRDIGQHSLALLTAKQRLVFPDFVRSRTGARINYRASKYTIDLMAGKADSLGLKLVWMTRNVLFTGLAIEMTNENFAPGLPEDYLN